MKQVSELDERGIVLLCPFCSTRNRMAYERLGNTFRCGNCHKGLEPPAEPMDIESEASFRAITRGSSLPVLVDFWAEWCGPCKMAAPEIVKAATEGRGQWLILKMNTELLPALAQEFQISAIPTMVLFQSGHEVARKSGALPARMIRQFIQQTRAEEKFVV